MSQIVSGQQLARWRRQAQAAGRIANIPDKEVDWLLQEVTDLGSLTLRLELFTQKPQLSLQVSFSQLEELWQQRLQQRVPIQYLVGKTPWRNFSLEVSPCVLIPRPETEYLVDLALEFSQKQELNQQGHWVDLGTGSGAIAFGLAEVLPQASIHAVDCSAQALTIAKKNAVRLNFSNIHFYQGSWWEPLELLQGKVSALVSNPPYIPSELVPQLQPEVANYEPHLALDGGNDGLDCLRHVIKTTPRYLHSHGFCLLEIMAGQGKAVARLLQEQGNYENVKIIPDLTGRDRFAFASRR